MNSATLARPMAPRTTRSTSEHAVGDAAGLGVRPVSESFDLVHQAIKDVEDPEIPVTLFDLGVLRSVEVVGDDIRVVLRPTRLGCPGRDRMERDLISAVQQVDQRYRVAVDWESVAWTDEDVTARGREVLREFGFAVDIADAACPYCSSRDVAKQGDFGGALCKLPYNCRACGSTFDVMRSSVPVAVTLRPSIDGSNDG